MLSADFSNLMFSKNYFWNTSIVFKSLDPDLRPDLNLGLNSLQRLSVDGKSRNNFSRQRVDIAHRQIRYK